MSLPRPRLLALVLTLLAAAPGLASAAEPADAVARVAAAFGNTVMTIYPDGRTQKIWLRPDGVWTGLSRAHQDLAGVWTLKGDKVCLRQKSPPTLPFSYCTAFPQDARVGVVWTSKDFAGAPIHLKLVQGMPPIG
jgi:hypothetical protein